MYERSEKYKNPLKRSFGKAQKATPWFVLVLGPLDRRFIKVMNPSKWRQEPIFGFLIAWINVHIHQLFLYRSSGTNEENLIRKQNA